MKYQTFTRCEGPIENIIVVGAGGIGARVIPALIKMVMPGTNIHVFDPDVVEERNLVRQNFSADDVGRAKAEVMADRYTTERIPVIPYVGEIEKAGVHINSGIAARGFIIAGVDNRRTRMWLRNFALNDHMLYIDAGNDGNGGQVLLAGFPNASLEGEVDTKGSGQWLTLDGGRAFPDMFNPELDAADEAPNCGYRIDTQTVLANMMAAQVALNYAGLWLYRMPIATVGATFSTLNNITPIPAEAAVNTIATLIRPRGSETEEEKKSRELREARELVRAQRAAIQIRNDITSFCAAPTATTLDGMVEAIRAGRRDGMNWIRNTLRQIREDLRTDEERLFLAAFDEIQRVEREEMTARQTTGENA